MKALFALLLLASCLLASPARKEKPQAIDSKTLDGGVWSMAWGSINQEAAFWDCNQYYSPQFGGGEYSADRGRVRFFEGSNEYVMELIRGENGALEGRGRRVTCDADRTAAFRDGEGSVKVVMVRKVESIQ